MYNNLFKSFLKPFYWGNNSAALQQEKDYCTHFSKLSKYFYQAYKKLDVLVQQKYSILNKKT